MEMELDETVYITASRLQRLIDLLFGKILITTKYEKAMSYAKEHQ